MEHENMDGRYRVSRYAHLCVSGDYVVFLDLASGDYSALPIAAARRLGGRIAGWPLSNLEGGEADALPQLLQEGLVTLNHVLGRPDASPVNAISPATSLVDLPEPERVKTRARHVIAFLWAVISAQFALRFISLRWITVYVQARKPHRSSADFDVDRAQRLIAIFYRLYPWMLGRSQQCLRDALILLQFLAWYRVYPDWVFAVRAKPFFAHCWLQHRDLLLNDVVARTLPLTPILRV